MAKQYNIFISHSWTYHSDLERLRAMINDRPYFRAIYSEVSRLEPINSLSATYIKSRLKERILSSNLIIGIAGIYASHSEWMVWELETALKNNIPIVGVVPYAAERVSTIVSSRAKEVVRWNTESIIKAIRNHAI